MYHVHDTIDPVGPFVAVPDSVFHVIVFVKFQASILDGQRGGLSLMLQHRPCIQIEESKYPNHAPSVWLMSNIAKKHGDHLCSINLNGWKQINNCISSFN